MLALVPVNTFAYKLLLFLHILSIVVAFAPAFVNPLLDSRLKAEGSSLADHPRISYILAHNGERVYGPALVLSGLFGIGMIFSSKTHGVQIFEFSQAWVSIAFVLWILLLGVVFAGIIPAEKKVADGRVEEAKHVAMYGGIAHLLFFFMLIDMIWKPGF
jgi:hypothetical protein